MQDINIKTLVEKIREELEEADRQRLARGKPPLFELQQLELELKVVVTESTSRQGGFDLKVVSAGGSGSVQSETVQTVRLSYRVASGPTAAAMLGSVLHSSAKQATEEGGVEVLGDK